MFNLHIKSLDSFCKIINESPTFVSSVVNDAKRHYSRVEIPKKGGTLRVIFPPSERLKKAQRLLLDYFSAQVQWPKYVTGGVPGGSVRRHAEPHTRKYMVACLDVKNFFPSISLKMLTFALNRNGLSEETADIVAKFVTVKNDEDVQSLPQGAPTSPFFANLVFCEADRDILALARKKELAYTRYVDDLALSGSSDFSALKGPLIQKIEKIGFKVAPNKVHFKTRAVLQVVTGLAVNDGLRPTPEYILNLSKMLKTAHWNKGIELEMLANEHGKGKDKMLASLNAKIAFVRQFDRKIARRLSQIQYSDPHFEDSGLSES